MRVEITTPERLMDGSPDPAATVPDGHYRVRASGLPASATLNATITYGAFAWSTSVTADANGVIGAIRTPTDPAANQVLGLLGGVSWDGAGPWRFETDVLSVLVEIA